MSDVKRYVVTCDANGIKRHELGGWVSHSDYEELDDKHDQLKAKLEKAEAEVKRLQSELKTETLRKELWTREFNRAQIARYEKQDEYIVLGERAEKSEAKIELLSNVVDKMAEYISTLDVDIDICLKLKRNHTRYKCVSNCKECIRKYFESEAKSDDV